jgi:hypothetical protein
LQLAAEIRHLATLVETAPLGIGYHGGNGLDPLAVFELVGCSYLEMVALTDPSKRDSTRFIEHEKEG